MICVNEAIKLLTENVTLTDAEVVPLKQCLGRVLAEDVISKVSHPPCDVSSMDGYALKAVETRNPPVTLKLIGESQAGGYFEQTVKTGETVRIFTGASLP